MTISKEMADAAKKDGAEVTPIRRVQKPKPVAEAPKVAEKAPVSANTGELKALRAEIKELRALVTSTEKDAEQRVQELSAIIAALAENKPFRWKPVRDMDPKSPTYLLVSHYDPIPVSYRKLDS